MRCACCAHIASPCLGAPMASIPPPNDGAASRLSRCSWHSLRAHAATRPAAPAGVSLLLALIFRRPASGHRRPPMPMITIGSFAFARRDADHRGNALESGTSRTANAQQPDHSRAAAAQHPFLIRSSTKPAAAAVVRCVGKTKVPRGRTPADVRERAKCFGHVGAQAKVHEDLGDGLRLFEEGQKTAQPVAELA